MEYVGYEEKVILVNNQDIEDGVMEKMQAHKEGKLHRAFSGFVFNSEDYLMLQQRAMTKYHSPGLWSNTVCSHPRPGETTIDAAHRRLEEEMGFDCEFREVDSFIYEHKFSNGLIEHEYDHVFTGVFDGTPKPNEVEVKEYDIVSLEEIREDMKVNPEYYTYWFKYAIDNLDLFKIKT